MMDPSVVELDSNFEPQTRARSNTWPLPRPENYTEIKDENDQISVDCANKPPPDASQLPKKSSSRRNAWGNMSYADLITQAIQSSPEKRLTLSQIYDWMVQNVPYFKDKGDSNSSAGWKNSIRHNLSLHNRFMRIQNEGTGKSSWWVINPDAKSGKCARRRATSMETSKYEKKRGRVKKKLEALRNGLCDLPTPSPSSSVSEGLDLFPESPLHSFQHSPADTFRPRASSNASSCGGRLSPIPAADVDLHEGSEVSPWSNNSDYRNQNFSSPGLYPPSGFAPEQLAGNLADGMKIGDNGFHPASMSPHAGLGNGCRNQQGYPQTYSPNEYHQLRYPEPAKLVQRIQHSPPMMAQGTDLGAPPAYGMNSMQALSPNPSVHSMSPQPMDANIGYSQGAASPQQRDSLAFPFCALSRNRNSSPRPSPPLHFITPKLEPQDEINIDNLQVSHMHSTPSQMMGHLMGALNSGGVIPTDLDFPLEGLSGGFDCNVDEVIKHELSMDGSLDFNFASHQGHHHAASHHHLHHSAQAHPVNGGNDSSMTPVSQQGVPYSQTVSAGRPWVH